MSRREENESGEAQNSSSQEPDAHMSIETEYFRQFSIFPVDVGRIFI